jgi:hypothetical protein
VTAPRLLLAALLATAVTVVTGGFVVGVRGEEEPTRQPVRRAAAAAALMHGWDDRRARAWASGDVGALRSLYTARSAAGRADRSMLRAWVGRGLRVEDLRMQLLAVRVREWSDRRVVLAVTDRLAGGIAVGEGVSVPLPRDGVSTRTVTLLRDAGDWRVAAVVAQPRPARTTSWTVRSRNP